MLAIDFVKIPQRELNEMAFNFPALNHFLFTKTEYSLLTKGKEDVPTPFTTGARDSLYNLSADGLGDIAAVERMPLVTYLSILRKKLIDAVKSMKSADMSLAQISDETGLSLNLLKQIV